MSRLSRHIRFRYQAGLSLVELLIAMSLLALLMLTFSNFVMKNNLMMSSVNMRLTESPEIQMLLSDIQSDLVQGAYISDNSHSERLEYTTFDSSGVAVKRIYQIVTESGVKYLKLSRDSGTTWESPYRVAPYTAYRFSGTPRFLYSAAANNCTNFVDTNGNGVWQTGVDAAGAYQTCTSGTSSPALDKPSQAMKVDLSGFVFSTGKGTPEALRTLPPNLFMEVGQRTVRSYSAVASPGVKDPPLVQSFATNTNGMYHSVFQVKCAAWDPSHERLIIIGGRSPVSTNPNNIYVADRLGVLMGSTTPTLFAYQVNPQAMIMQAVAVKNSGTSILVLGNNGGINNVYTYDITGTPPLSSATPVPLTGLVNTPTGIAYDAGTPNDFYVVGTNPVTSAIEITQRNATSGVIVGTAWALPAAFTASRPPGGLAIDPATGNFLVVRNYVNGSSPNKTIDIYTINRQTSASSYFSVNIDDLSSTAATNAGNWGLGYDALLNRLFLSDTVTNKVYEVALDRLLSPQN